MARFKAVVGINEAPGVGDIDLELTPDQAVTLLEYVVTGATAHINLKTPQKINGVATFTENPAAYAE